MTKIKCDHPFASTTIARSEDATTYLSKREQRFVLFNLPGDETSWRGLGLLGLVFFGSLVVAALLLPFAYGAFEWWSTTFNAQAARAVLSKGPGNLFDFLRWIPIFIGLPWIMSVCKLWSLETLGLGRTAVSRRYLANGFVAGVVLVAALAVGQLLSGAVVVAPRESLSLLVMVKWTVIAFTIAIGVAVIEEIIFRGIILRIFYTATHRPWLALAVSAIFFAYTHFKIPANSLTNGGPMTWQTGWLAAYWMLFGIVPNFELNRFVALSLLGLVLGALTLRTGSLWPAIGLHGGLVFGMLMYHDLARNLASTHVLWGGTTLIDGWAAAAALGFLFVLLWRSKLPADMMTT